MDRFGAGDEQAFDELFQRNAAGVYRIAVRFVGSPDDANDILQEAFLRVFLARDKWVPKAKFTTWLYRIVVNLCLKQRRREKGAACLSLDSSAAKLGADPPVNPASPEECDARNLLLRKELAAAVREAIQALPADQRMAVMLHRYEGLSYKEIAHAMRRSVSSVESLLHRAKRTLRERLRPWAGG